MNELQTFANAEFGQIRIVMLENQPWFVGKDVALSLGYKAERNAITAHVDEEDKLTHQISASGQKRRVTIINESGLYSLILSSKLESAKRFKRWVTSEVLPCIRETGTFSLCPAEQQTAAQRDITPDDYLRAASIVATCKNNRLPYVLAFLSKGGIETPQLAQYDINAPAEAVTLMRQLKAEKHMSNMQIGTLLGLDTVQTSRYIAGTVKPSAKRATLIIETIERILDAQAD